MAAAGSIGAGPLVAREPRPRVVVGAASPGVECPLPVRPAVPAPVPVGSAPPSSAGISMPVRPFTAAPASATVRVVVRTTSDAPSDESTVSDPMLAIGSAAARTISGSIESTVWITAASLNWR